MSTTGNSFADFLFIAITFLPLVPAILILLFRNFGKEPMDLILIICLVNFTRDFPVHLHMLSKENQGVIGNVCYPIELFLFARLFRATMERSIRSTLTIVLVAFLSSLLTWLSIKGWENNNPGLESLKSGVLIGLILLSLPPLVRSKGLEIFHSPLFWIAGGTLFYLLILLLLEWVNPCCVLSPAPLNAENSIFLSLAALARYLLYILAVLSGRDTPAEPTKGSF
jgi:hypothetical protein